MTHHTIQIGGRYAANALYAGIAHGEHALEQHPVPLRPRRGIEVERDGLPRGVLPSVDVLGPVRDTSRCGVITALIEGKGDDAVLYLSLVRWDRLLTCVSFHLASARERVLAVPAALPPDVLAARNAMPSDSSTTIPATVFLDDYGQNSMAFRAQVDAFWELMGVPLQLYADRGPHVRIIDRPGDRAKVGCAEFFGGSSSRARGFVRVEALANVFNGYRALSPETRAQMLTAVPRFGIVRRPGGGSSAISRVYAYAPCAACGCRSLREFDPETKQGARVTELGVKRVAWGMQYREHEMIVRSAWGVSYTSRDAHQLCNARYL